MFCALIRNSYKDVIIQDKFNKSWSILFAFIIAEMKDAYLTHVIT
jgi:hypothetical protein